MSNIVVVIEGGLVQEVITDDVRLHGVKLYLVDHDTEGGGESEFSDVTRSSKVSPAYIRSDCITVCKGITAIPEDNEENDRFYKSLDIEG